MTSILPRILNFAVQNYVQLAEVAFSCHTTDPTIQNTCNLSTYLDSMELFEQEYQISKLCDRYLWFCGLLNMVHKLVATNMTWIWEHFQNVQPLPKIQKFFNEAHIFRIVIIYCIFQHIKKSANSKVGWWKPLVDLTWNDPGG